MNEIYKRITHLNCDWSPNCSIDFIPTDSKKRWKNTLENSGRNVSAQYYIESPIKYNLNNFGFRTPDDFNSEEEGNVFLGCSHTFGIGHHLENVWSYKLNQKIGGKFWNLGAGGTGVMTHFRFLLGFYKELKIKNIFHYAPKYPRYEFIENGLPQNYIVGDYKKEWETNFGNLLINSLLTDEQCDFNWLSYTNAIKGLASEIGCPYYLIGGASGFFGNVDSSLQARDLIHHTTLVQHSIYKEFLTLCDPTLLDEEEDKNPIFDIETLMKSKKTSLI